MQRRGRWWWRPGRAGLDWEGMVGAANDAEKSVAFTAGVWGYWKRRHMEIWRGAPRTPSSI
jgi:hypothetical protein